MERVRSYVSRAKKASSNRDAEYAYKPKKEAPFGLQTDTSSVLGEILQADSTLRESVTGLMAQAKATSAMENYERVTKKFADFCVENGYTYPDYSEKATLHFIIQADKDRASMATLCQIKPALMLVEQLAGKEGSAWTEIVNTFLVSAKRRAAIEKPAVKKAGILPDDTLFQLQPVCFLPHLTNTD
jgi:hypothetical protein